MRILGIDPGLQITGYGVVDFSGAEPCCVDAGVLRFSAKQTMPQKLLELDRELTALFEEFHPDICAVEQLYAHYKHPRTAILMGHARGVILLAAERAGVSIEQFPANRIKKSVLGYGHADKMQVQRAVKLALRMKEIPGSPDMADALAVALCCGRQTSKGVSHGK